MSISSQIVTSFATFSKNTPLWDVTGQMPDADHPVDSVCSFASIYDQIGAKNKSFAPKYQEFVVNYAVEWEKTVTTRVSNGLKKTEDQRRELNHYQKKVEALRLSTNKVMASGKSVKADAAEKLKRNEEKLIAAKQTYNKMTTQLCILMEEVSERSWRDLHPLLVKVVQFDMTIANDEAKILANCSQIVSKLKGIADANGISPQPRLKDLGTLNPELLSTRPGGVAGLSIEAAASPLSGSGPTSPLFGLSPTGDMAFQPGPGAQGMGGFPVRVASGGSLPGPPQDPNHMSRASSFSSYGSGYGSAPQPSTQSFEPPSTLSMLNISQASAPAPTMDDLYGSSFNSGRPPSAPSSSNLPPLAPSAMNYAQNRSNSLDSFGSGVAGPPATAPPPPPASAPPPPGAYGGAMVPAPSSAGSPYAMSAPPPANDPFAAYGQPPSPYGQPPMQSYGQPHPPPQQGTNPFGF